MSTSNSNSNSNRIDATFAALKASNRKALIPFITAGDPSLDSTLPTMHALAMAGADVIELGVPFSDPMADGPVIQRSSERALAKGMSLRKVLAIVTEFRKTNSKTPVVLMGYANPVERYDLRHGKDAFIRDAAMAGVDGVLVVDYPPEECVEFAAKLREENHTLKRSLTDPTILDGIGRFGTVVAIVLLFSGGAAGAITGAALGCAGALAVGLWGARDVLRLPAGKMDASAWRAGFVPLAINAAAVQVFQQYDNMFWQAAIPAADIPAWNLGAHYSPAQTVGFGLTQFTVPLALVMLPRVARSAATSPVAAWCATSAPSRRSTSTAGSGTSAASRPAAARASRVQRSRTCTPAAARSSASASARSAAGRAAKPTPPMPVCTLRVPGGSAACAAR